MPGPKPAHTRGSGPKQIAPNQVSPVAHPPSLRSSMSYYVHSIDNQGLTVITAPSVLPANRAGAPKTRQKHVAMTHYAPVIDRWRLLIPSRKRTAILSNPASAPRESHSNPRQEPRSRATSQIDNCKLSTVEHQSTSQAPPRLTHTLTRAEAAVMQGSLRRCLAQGLPSIICPTLSIVMWQERGKARQREQPLSALAMRRTSAMVCTRSAHTYAPVQRHQVFNLAPRPAHRCQGRAVPLRRLTSLRRACTTFRLSFIIHEERIAFNHTPSLDCPPRMDKPSGIG